MRFGDGGDARHEDSGRARIQRRRDLFRRMAGYPHEHRHAMDVAGADQILQPLAADLGVLGVDAEKVRAGGRRHLDGDGMGNRGEGADQRFA